VAKTEVKKIRWGRLFLLLVRLVLLIIFARVLIDWLVSLMPDDAGFVRGAVGVLYVPLMVIFVVKPALQECGIKST
jgi:hypothetical protein